jgi:AsmA family protein
LVEQKARVTNPAKRPVVQMQPIDLIQRIVRMKKWTRAMGGRRAAVIAISIAVCAALLLGGVAMFPFSILKGSIEKRLSDRLGTEVHIGAVERNELFSFTPRIILSDVEIRQPEWAGKGAMAKARDIVVDVRMAPLFRFSPPKPVGFVVRGLDLNLVRDAEGRENWTGPKAPDRSDDDGTGLSDLVIQDARFSLNDMKRSLNLRGAMTSDAKGLRIDSRGTFHGSAAAVRVTGAPIVGWDERASYPVRLDMTSSLLDLHAKGQTRGALNLAAMAARIDARATNLNYLDDIIEAGLFGTQPIRVNADISRKGPDWHITRMAGTIGRSPFTAKADILKREGRTKIAGEVRFRALDFDDLADDQGLAKARARKARLGPRVLPATRINLAKIGPTDGTLRFQADKLLLSDSLFRSLSGTISLQGKLLTLGEIDAGMKQGRMVGTVTIDQRGRRAHPLLTLDLATEGSRLEALMGSDQATGVMRGRIKLKGTGDTISEALANADGTAGIFVRDGQISALAAAVLGQDLGKTIEIALKDKSSTVPLQCMAARFAARGGKLRPDPLVIGTQISVGEGVGAMSLQDESIALTIRGRARDPSALKLVDPITIGGIFSAPSVSVSGKRPEEKLDAGDVLSAVGKSIGNALGLRDKKPAESRVRQSVDCDALQRRVLGKE